MALAAGVHPEAVQERLRHAHISNAMDTCSRVPPGLQ